MFGPTVSRFTGKSLSHDGRTQILMVLPLALSLLLLTVLPLIATIGVSFTDLDLAYPNRWAFIELGQYDRLLGDSRWWEALSRGVIYIVVPTALQMFLGLVLALLLHSGFRLIRATRTLFILPMVLPPVVVGVLWKAFLLRGIGGLDYFIGLLGIPAPGLLETAEGALAAIIVTLTWEWTPFVMLLLLAGLQSLPEEPFEAARIDGASGFQIIRYVTLPLLRPTLLVVLLFRVIESTKAFPVIFTITGGGPGQSTENMDFYAYLVGFRYFDLGYAAAMLVAILLIFAVLCVPLFRVIVKGRSN
ncbi:MAG: sugar ABC transporter permease [Dehalococcoidales bacterium]|nr:sugar ABC transporter permease [Dehalococcoidales bacterium]